MNHSFAAVRNIKKETNYINSFKSFKLIYKEEISYLLTLRDIFFIKHLLLILTQEITVSAYLKNAVTVLD